MSPPGPRKKTLEVARRTPAPASELENRKILVVDDDRASVALIQNALAAHGYRFLTAHDGVQALSAIREARPDLIVMDVEMPRLSGVEVCRIVKANAGESGFGFIPVILMTARQASRKIESLELGADDYLVKPFDMLELSARVKSMLRLKVLQDALVVKNRELELANRELAQRREELLALSRTDALTGLFNRRYFEERFAVEFARSDRYRAPLSCMMIDIDHFKRINDTWGHPFGDKVLQAVARVAVETLRDVDMVARYGGEELIALLPETGPQEALRVSERVRAGIEALDLWWKGPDGRKEKVQCTASIGVATFPTPAIDSAEAFLRAADECLYAAKEGGRNRVVQYEE
ncbi:MAG: diguanylate cyclase [Myxococcaceae bacterium]|nr:diguanylate cyclase [Myxococcaceae bacterium]